MKHRKILMTGLKAQLLSDGIEKGTKEHKDFVATAEKESAALMMRFLILKKS